ncbi:MAG: chromate transporter [Bacteroidaceae bacterium]|nr:chromate transporter [Bacteroidaceae bacterium]
MFLLYIRLFIAFFQIGLFGFGGGYAMLSMIQGEVVAHNHWLSTSEFTDIVAISQMTPGPIGINSATYCGYTAAVNDAVAQGLAHPQVWGLVGSLTATFAVVLPSLLLMLLVCRFLMRYSHHPSVEYVFSGLRPAVVGLLAAAALCLMTRENFSRPDENAWQFFVSVFLFVAAFLGTRKFKVHPILMICLCGAAGLLLL